MFLNYLKPTNIRQIPHFRIDDEDVIFKKYELGKKTWTGKFWRCLRVKQQRNRSKVCYKNN